MFLATELKTFVVIVKRFGLGKWKGLNFEREAPSNSRCFVEIKEKGDKKKEPKASRISWILNPRGLITWIERSTLILGLILDGEKLNLISRNYMENTDEYRES